MYWTDTFIDGVYDLLPPKTRGTGANTFLSAEITASLFGTVVVDGPAAVVVGVYDSTLANPTFIPFDDGVLSVNAVVVNHGLGARLAASVTGANGSSRIGYAGASK